VITVTLLLMQGILPLPAILLLSLITNDEVYGKKITEATINISEGYLRMKKEEVQKG